MQIDNGKVFDDESDRWITRLEGETDRDALLRNRAESSSTPRKPRQSGRSRVAGANPYAAALWILGAAAVAFGFIVWSSAVGALNNADTDPYLSDPDAARSWAAFAGTVGTAGGFLLVLAVLLSGMRWIMDNAASRR